MADSYIQAPLDGSGKKVDSGSITRDDGTVVYKQRIGVSDEEDRKYSAVAAVRGEQGDGRLIIDGKALGTLENLLTEIREIKMLLTMAVQQ